MKNRHGFTMIEVLIVIAILALLVIASIFYVYPNMARGRDGKRMSDLTKIKIAFEDYYNDNECYPPITTLESYCGGTPNGALDPYMQSVPCDPRDHSAYFYTAIAGETNISCPTKGYRILTNLERDGSEASLALNCGGPYGCGVGLEGVYYDYGIGQGEPVSMADPDETPPPPLPPGETPPPTSTDWCCVDKSQNECLQVSLNPSPCIPDFHGPGAQQSCQASCHD